MSLITGLISIALPWIAASMVLRQLWSDSSSGRSPLVLGYGYVLGLSIAASLLGLQARLGLGFSGLPLLIMFALIIIVMISKRESLSFLEAGSIKAWFRADSEGSRVTVWATFAILGLLAIRFLSIGYETFDQGLYGWDAFTTWAYRARVWIESDQMLQPVTPEAWLAERDPTLIALPASNYPALASLIMAWPASVLGGWSEKAVLMPWIFLYPALGLGLYGQCRLWGATKLESLVFVWFLLSLPLVGSQIAIAGYADLWLASTIGFAFMAFVQWLRTRDRAQGLLAVLLVLISVFIKAEGVVWAALFVPPLLMTRLSARGWSVLAVFAAIALVALGVSGGVTVDLPALGRLELSLERVYSTMTGEFVFSGQPGVLRPLMIHFFVFDTWHLLMAVIFFVFVWQIVELMMENRHSAAWPLWRRAALVWVVSIFGGYYLLFFWTFAAEWVRLGTSVNRIVLHFAPGLIFWLQCLWVSRRENVASC